MQASKIKVGARYALRHKDKFVRFVVEAVVTRRESDHGNPHDYKSTVEGIIQAPDNDGHQPLRLTVSPDAVLGPYTEYVELVEREATERAARDAVTKAEADRVDQLWSVLYQATGLAPPNEQGGWQAPFRLGHRSKDIIINQNGVEALLRALEGKSSD